VLQEAMSAFEACPVPVIAAVHGHCVGAGIDMITACDIRLATDSAVFCVKANWCCYTSMLIQLYCCALACYVPLSALLPCCLLPAAPLPAPSPAMPLSWCAAPPHNAALLPCLLHKQEADLAIVADMGTLQRLPAIVGHGATAELALTARDFSGAEAKELRLVSQSYKSQEALMAAANAMARTIAAKSPLAVCGTKRVLLYQRDHSVADGLDYVATWNSAMLPQSADVQEVFLAQAQRRRPIFSRL
jgi:enoyl-CoA hydratase/carnithine racemase